MDLYGAHMSSEMAELPKQTGWLWLALSTTATFMYGNMKWKQQTTTQQYPNNMFSQYEPEAFPALPHISWH